MQLLRWNLQRNRKDTNMKYKINKRRAIKFLAALFAYAAVSLYGSLCVKSWVTGLFIQLALTAVVSVAFLYHMFQPIERIDHEKAQTAHNTGDCCSDSSHP